MGGNRAFTLIEMIMVMAIMVILAGIGIGAFLSIGKSNPLLATEQVVADAVRQARHTARSTGSPVVLNFRKVERSIAGVTRTPLWAQNFENAPAGAGLTYLVPGFTGMGLILDKRTVDEAPLWTNYEIAAKTLPPRFTLVRSIASNVPDGFYIGCAVRPPSVWTVAPAQGVCAVMTIGPNPDLDTCHVALILQRHAKTVQSAGGQSVTIATWEFVARFGADATQRISSVDDVRNPDANDYGSPMVGETWEDLGLLYDGQNAVLYRNGQIIGSKAITMPIPTSAANIHLGQLTIPSLVGNPPYNGQGTVIDEVRIYRLGNGSAGRLPDGVVPTDDFRVVANPDGKIALASVNGSPPPSAMTFIHRNDPVGPGGMPKTYATVSIDRGGAVTSQIVSPANPKLP